MRPATAAAWGLAAMVAAWDVAASPWSALPRSVAICVVAVLALAPALVRAPWSGFALGLWTRAGRASPYLCAALFGASHFMVKQQPGSAAVLSLAYVAGLIALVEVASWARDTSAPDLAVGDGADSAWARSFASRFVPLATLGVGLGAASIALAVGLNGTWSALALAVGLVTMIVLTARSAARVA
jgi:hypothetical protein